MLTPHHKPRKYSVVLRYSLFAEQQVGDFSVSAGQQVLVTQDQANRVLMLMYPLSYCYSIGRTATLAESVSQHLQQYYSLYIYVGTYLFSVRLGYLP